MIVSKTPIRISLGAGGTDLPAFYTKHGAKFATGSGSKYTYVMVNKHPEKIVWMGMQRAERVDSPEELAHKVVRKVLTWMDIRSNIEVVSMSDVQPNSGLGTSSSFIVGLLNALHAYRDEHPWADELAEEACYVEQSLLGEKTGKQDQYAAALGGIMWLEISKDGRVAASRLSLKKDFLDELNGRMAFCYTGIQRSSTDIHGWHSNGLASPVALESLMKIQEVAIDIRKALEKQDIVDFGHLLGLHWKYKRTLSNKVTSDSLDRIYDLAMRSGAIGGNLMGAGGGGHFVFVCPDGSTKSRVCRRLDQVGIHSVEMKFELQGSTITRLS